MIVKFFARGKGGGSGPTDYLLGKNRDRENAKVLLGDPEETKALIDSCKFSKKYTSGVLSFEEANITEEKKYELMASFEDCLFPDMDKNKYNVLWVEHTDKGRLELNFVIPNIELVSGKRLQPYYHAADLKRVDAWRTIQNLENGFSDPTDPAKKQGLVMATDLPATKKQAVEAINQGIETLAEAGIIKNRADVLAALKQSGFEIARETKSSISIKNPDGGQNIRLKGAFYEQSFDLSRELRADLQSRSKQHKEASNERLATARNEYQFGIARKREELAKRYPRKRPGNGASIIEKQKTNDKKPIQKLGLVSGVVDIDSPVINRLELVPSPDNQQSAQKYSKRKKDLRELTRESDIYDGRQGEEIFNNWRQRANEVQGEDGRMGNTTGGAINDEYRENLVRYTEIIKRRISTGTEAAARSGADVIKGVERLDRANEQLHVISRAGAAVSRAKQAISRAVKQIREVVIQQREKNRGFRMR